MCLQGKPEAVPVLLSLLGKASDKEKPGIILKLAELKKRLGNFSEASNHYRMLAVNHPAAVEGLKAADQLAWLVFNGKIPRVTFSEAEQTGRASRFYANGRFDLAAVVYTDLLKTKPKDKTLMFKLAQCRFKERQNHRAIGILKELLAGDVPEKLRIEALYLLSLVHWRLDNERDFESCCNKILASGQQGFRKKALFNLAAYSLERGRLSAAQNHFDKLLASNPEPSVRVTVKWKTAWIRYLGGQYARLPKPFTKRAKWL